MSKDECPLTDQQLADLCEEVDDWEFLSADLRDARAIATAAYAKGLAAEREQAGEARELLRRGLCVWPDADCSYDRIKWEDDTRAFLAKHDAKQEEGQG